MSEQISILTGLGLLFVFVLFLGHTLQHLEISPGSALRNHALQIPRTIWDAKDLVQVQGDPSPLTTCHLSTPARQMPHPLCCSSSSGTESLGFGILPYALASNFSLSEPKL